MAYYTAIKSNVLIFKDLQAILRSKKSKVNTSVYAMLPLCKNKEEVTLHMCVCVNKYWKNNQNQ